MDDAQGYLRERAADIRSNGHTLTAEMHENIADYISRLEAVVRAADELHAGAEKAKAEVGIAQSEFGYDSIRFADVRHGALYVLGKIKPYQEARSRVTLPPSPTSDGTATVDDGFGTSATKCGDDCTLQVNRPGDIRCDGSGARCPNKEATNGKA